jgi:23S rRNA (adenine2030-N6)-methyltransferase
MGLVANRHFAKLADVWKHLVLAEVLAVDRPDALFDTHAGHALYAMADDAERRFGVLGFMEVAGENDDLSKSTYFGLLRAPQARLIASNEYPAGPTLAMLTLGESCRYLFCDLDSESCENIRQVAARLGLEARVQVVEGDGMATVRGALTQSKARGRPLVYSDPFDHRAVGAAGFSALDLAKQAAQDGTGVVYWYGYNRADQRAWIFNVLRANAPTVDWWCGDVMVTAPDTNMHDGDLGIPRSAQRYATRTRDERFQTAAPATFTSRLRLRETPRTSRRRRGTLSTQRRARRCRSACVGRCGHRAIWGARSGVFLVGPAVCRDASRVNVETTRCLETSARRVLGAGRLCRWRRSSRRLWRSSGSAAPRV